MIFPESVTSSCWVEVLVDCPGTQGPYVYRIPPPMAVQPGDILAVPLGARQVGGIALQLLDSPPPEVNPDQIRLVEGILNQRFFTRAYWTLLERVAEYYQAPLMQVLRTALPPGLLARSQRRVRLCPDRLPPNAADLASPAVSQLLQQLQQSPSGDYTWQYLQRQGGNSRRALHQLIQRGWVESYLVPPKPPKPKRQQAVTVLTPVETVAETLSPRQREILSILQRRGGDLWLSEALQLCKTTSTTLKRLAQQGHLVIEHREVLRTEQGLAAAERDQPKSLTVAQQQALERIQQQIGACQILLHGVTGSGKTEIYLQAIAPCLERGQSALVLVPEIGLTPQLTDRFRRRFGSKVWVYHSGLSDGERYDTWRQLLEGRPQVVIGTRSAVFLPVPNLGLLILDEEHDSSFKQDQPSPCYHTRTVARWRSSLEDCPLILGSATPSLETWIACHDNSNHLHGLSQPSRQEPANWPADSSLLEQENPPSSSLHKSHSSQATRFPEVEMPGLYLSLPERIQSRPLPPIQVIDMRQELQRGNRSIFSHTLQTALQQMKSSAGQGILFIHRRGHSSFVSCRSCGHVMMCPHCDVSLAYHQPQVGGAMTLRCHYCGFIQGHPRNCPSCASPYLKHFGSGTQRVVHALSETLPELRCLRFDSDTTRRKGAHRALLEQFAAGEADLLVGTQMLTKGIDLPQVTLVGVIAADGLLYMGDYWASERAFQTLTQVAGRAGRGEDPGQVILQTYTPEHSVVEAVRQQTYQPFIEAERAQRAAMGYPPLGRLVLLRLTSPDPVAVQQTAQQIADQVRSRLPDEGYELLGPAPAPILRVARRYRWHLLLKSVLSAPIPDLQDLRQHCPQMVNLTVDIDPLNLS